MISGGPRAGVAGLQPAHGRLEHLYEISKLFATFKSVEQTFEPALGIVTQTIPLRSAILIEAEADRSEMTVWPSEGQTSAELQSVKDQAGAAHRYLVGAASPESLPLSERAGKTTLPRQAETQESLRRRFVVIPLVVPHRRTFGTLTLEGARALDKGDLMFVGVIANQLAIALDRDRAWQRDIARRDDAESGRIRAEAIGATTERELILAELSRDKSAALAADNARLYEQAQQAVRVRDHILAIVTHDLRNPLTTILMTIGILSKRPVPEERRRGLPVAVGRIRRAAERMVRLIEDLLDFGSIENGRLAVHRRSEDPRLLVEETLSSFEVAAEENRLELTADIGVNLPRAYCDRGRILQILSNLIGNAVKVVSDGGHIRLRVAAGDHELVFSVSDDGPGIAAEDVQHLFERYWRSGDALYKGSGLGLAIARGIVDAHGGRIWAESELGKGATFWFTVPEPAESGPTDQPPLD